MRFFLGKKLRIFLISAISNALIIGNGFASPKKEIVYIEEGGKAPYSGVLFPVEKAGELRKMAIELDALKTINASYEKTVSSYVKMNELTEQKVNTLLEQNDKLSLALIESRESNDLQKIVWFALGVAATGLALYGAKEAIK
jgi:hypothetical protein